MYGSTEFNEEDGHEIQSDLIEYDGFDERNSVLKTQYAGSLFLKVFSVSAAAFMCIIYLTIATNHEISLKPLHQDFESEIPSSATSLPNLIFILTDDQGMGDMDITGGDFENLMPNIRRMNAAGLNLTWYYSASLCTPARSSLMTGRYPLSNGMQHGVVMGTKPWGLSLSEKLMPEYLLEAGYDTYHVGKWHLGHYSKSHLPTARGFNSSFGYYGGYQHPESYLYEWPGCSNETGCVPDMHRNNERWSDPDKASYFNSYLLRDEAVSVIRAQDPARPFFLYFAVPLLHMPVHPDTEVMRNYSEALSGLSDMWRRRVGAMAIMLDTVVQDVYMALTETGQLQNSIIVFASDNGAQSTGNQMGAGSNYPLRGAKGSLYEGAVRVPAFVYAPMLGHTFGVPGSTVSGVVHVTDWLPTLLSAAGRRDLIPEGGLDGVDQWDYFSGTTSVAPRTLMLYNIDTTTGQAALRWGSWKLLLNESTFVGWFDGSGSDWGIEYCSNTATNTVQLFNLAEDEQERTDLSLQQSQVVDTMRAILDEYTSGAQEIAFCDTNDGDAADLWFAKKEVEPWISLEDSSEDYPCPTFTLNSGWCDLVSADTPMPLPPLMGVHMGGSSNVRLAAVPDSNMAQVVSIEGAGPASSLG